MGIVRNGLLTAILLAAGAQPGMAATPADNDAAELTRLTNDVFLPAVVNGDPAALDRIFAADFFFRMEGSTLARGPYLDSIRTDKDRYANKNFRWDDILVDRFGDVAVVSGRTLSDDTIEGTKVTKRTRFVDVWQKQNGTWKVLFATIYRSAEPKPATN